MIFLNEHEKRIKELYTKLSDLKQGKKILENAMNKCFYNRPLHQKLFEKLKKINENIKQTREELEKEKHEYEKSRKNI